MEREIKIYITYLKRIKRLSENTLLSYQRDLLHFSSYLEKRGIFDVREVTKEQLADYLEDLEKHSYKPASLARRLASCRTFFSYMEKEGFCKGNPTQGFHSPKMNRTLPMVLTGDEISRLLKQPDEKSDVGLRDRAMLEVMYAGGLRVSELLALKMSDINVEMSYLICRDGENERLVPFHFEARQALMRYILIVRGNLLKNEEDDTVFLNYTGTPMSRQSFWKLIKKYAKRAGIRGDITPHTLRHSFAVHRLQKGEDMESVREILGHTDVNTTKKYYDAGVKSPRL